MDFSDFRRHASTGGRVGGWSVGQMVPVSSRAAISALKRPCPVPRCRAPTSARLRPQSSSCGGPLRRQGCVSPFSSTGRSLGEPGPDPVAPSQPQHWKFGYDTSCFAIMLATGQQFSHQLVLFHPALVRALALTFTLLFLKTRRWANQIPELFAPDTLPLRLHSFHVLGLEDPFLPTTKVLRDCFLGDDGKGGEACPRSSHEHPSGHRPLPPGPADAQAAAEAVRAFLEDQICRKERGELPLWCSGGGRVAAAASQ